MGIQRWVRFLLPREDHFYDFLEQQAVTAHDGALALATFKDGSSAPEVRERVQKHEHEGDRIVHDRWVIVACAAAIALGTAAGGKRIIKTMGTKIIRIAPLQGFAAETAGAMTILAASHIGVPDSTTHCINACIMGVGASRRISAVRWGVAGNILIAWVLTLPLSGLAAFATMILLRALGG